MNKGLLDMGRKKLTNEEIKQRIFELVEDEYTKLDDTYINSKAKFKIKHEKCGHEYEVSWNAFQKGKRCPKCAGLTKLTNEDIVKRIHDLVGNEYTKLDDTYINNQTKFLIRHNLCSHEYEVSWHKFHGGKRCPKCAGLTKLTNEDIVKRIHDLVGNEYTKLDNSYVNSLTKFKIKHNLCGHEYMVSWNIFQQGYRCPKCNQSKGEKFIEDYLTNKNIAFNTQKKFDDCRFKYPLPFDFAVLDDKKIIALIEFDGQQHFEPVKAWGGEENLKLTQLRDQIKNEYCKAHNIPLLRIRYDEDIEERLDKFLGLFFLYIKTKDVRKWQIQGRL